MTSSTQTSPSQPMVQSILESFTRCFSPLDPCTKVCSSNEEDDYNYDPPPRKSKSSSNTPSNIFGYNNDVPRTVSRSSSSSSSRNKQRHHSQSISGDVSYDADGVARAKKTHHRMSAEAMAERSLKRKLEIFRGTGNDNAKRPPSKMAPRKQSSSSRNSQSPPSSGGGVGGAGPSSNGQHLALSDDEEELIRLTQSRRRFACGVNMDRNSPISSVARLFNFGLTEAQKPFGLCFATPVRTASMENVANLSDDKLTDTEYMRRHVVADAAATTAQISPDNDQSSYCEEETISSTLYFDQKYSHVVQTRAPMPLFAEHMVSCGDADYDELSKIISRRAAAAAGKGRGGGGVGSSSPPVKTLVTSKQQRGKWGIKKTGSRDPPSPIRLGDESISITTVSEESFEEAERMMAEI
mmetsp:Transcript_24370/g.51052  ORF Transcript_24370/g.51052 Transcript_24370/m.51052 type:complete len:410 (-) Transcript_24370:146-1375(-)